MLFSEIPSLPTRIFLACEQCRARSKEYIPNNRGLLRGYGCVLTCIVEVHGRCSCHFCPPLYRVSWTELWPFFCLFWAIFRQVWPRVSRFLDSSSQDLVQISLFAYRESSRIRNLQFSSRDKTWRSLTTPESSLKCRSTSVSVRSCLEVRGS